MEMRRMSGVLPFERFAISSNIRRRITSPLRIWKMNRTSSLTTQFGTALAHGRSFIYSASLVGDSQCPERSDESLLSFSTRPERLQGILPHWWQGARRFVCWAWEALFARRKQFVSRGLWISLLLSYHQRKSRVTDGQVMRLRWVRAKPVEWA